MEYELPEQSYNLNTDIASFEISSWIVYLAWAAAIILLLWLAKKLLNFLVYNSKHPDHVIYQIKLPKDKPGEKDGQGQNMNYLQKLKEDIGRGETVFKAIGGLRAQRWYKGFSWLFGRNDCFSFEIVASQKLISFYAVAPRPMGRYLEQQIQAYYPEAVMEEVGDYNIFNPHSAIAAGFLKTTKDDIYPIKTFNKMEADPLNSIINVLSKLDEDETMAIQYVVRSSHPKWHNKVNHIVHEVNKGKSLSGALHFNVIDSALSFLHTMGKDALNAKNNPNEKTDSQYRLSAMEQEILKSIEDKNAKAGLDVNLRIIVSAREYPIAKAYLNNIISAFSQYNYYQYGNLFKNKLPIYNNLIQTLTIRDFIYRRFKPSISFLLNTEELTSLYHFPLSGTETPNILWLTAKMAPAPANIPDEGIILGHNYYRGVKKDIKIKRNDRRRHSYVLGKSGVGKSQLIANMAIQDIVNGEGVCVLDPHGDLVEEILSRIPPERADDVIIFSPADLERPIALNLLDYDQNYPEQKTFVINEMIGIFDKLYDLKQTGGPIFEQYMRNSLLLIMSDPDSGSTLMEIPKVLSNPAFRRMKLDRCKDPTVVDFWRMEAEKAGGDAALANIVPYITSKLTSFISNDMMRPIIGQQKSSFNFRDIMDNQKILLIDLPKGLVGEMNAYLLGMVLVGKILMSALSRANMPEEKRKDFYLYIDEFQNFTTNSICQILSEARKYALNLIIAHQYIGQLVKNNDNSLKDAVFGNVGSMMVFKVGSEDAQFLEKEFSPVFNQYDLININKYTAYIKLLVDNTATRPFSMATPWPIAGTKRDDMSKKLRSLSRLKFGRDKNIVESEIMNRTRSEEKG